MENVSPCFFQAKNLVWADLTEEQLGAIRNPHPRKGLTARELLARFLSITDPKSPLNAIILDLYVHTLQFGQASAAWTVADMPFDICCDCAVVSLMLCLPLEDVADAYIEHSIVICVCAGAEPF